MPTRPSIAGPSAWNFPEWPPFLSLRLAPRKAGGHRSDGWFVRVRSWLLCDDIRIESNGKHLFIGVYSGIIKLRRPLPVALPMLSFRI